MIFKEIILCNFPIKSQGVFNMKQIYIKTGSVCLITAIISPIYAADLAGSDKEILPTMFLLRERF